MPAQQQATVFTAYLSPTTDDVDVGDCMVLNSAGTYYVTATAAARSAASRTICVAGIALTAGDAFNRHVEIQTVGPCPPSITGLGAGSAGPIIVNSSGRLERKATPITSDVVAGKCDADGWAYLNFTSRDGGDSVGTPIDASYVTLGTNSTLTSERVLTAGTGITLTDAGAGSTLTAATTTTPAGSADEIQTKATATTFSAATNVKAGSGYISVGATPATTGALRMANDTGIYWRNVGNSSNSKVLTYDSSNVLRLGEDGNTGPLVCSYSSLAGFYESGTGYRLLVTSGTDIALALPLRGYATLSAPFRLKSAAITQSSTADTTLTSSQYECPMLSFSGSPGGAFNVIAPNTADTFFIVYNGTASPMTIKKSGGTGVTIGSAKTAIVRHNGSDYVRVTADA